MLKIENLHAQIDELKILNGISLEVKPGEIHAILGPNGSGKSTLGRVILGDETVTQTDGSIGFNGEEFDEEMEISDRAKAGFFLTFQSPPELDGVNVKDFLFAAKKSLDPEFKSSFRFKKNLAQTLEDIRLGGDFVDREVNKGFSGGERKKIEVASLLALNPACAFLDEIDSGVDIDTIRQIGKSLKTFVENKDKALILVTHSEKLLQELPPTHVHIFVKGKIVKSGGPELIKEAHDLGFDQHN